MLPIWMRLMYGACAKTGESVQRAGAGGQRHTRARLRDARAIAGADVDASGCGLLTLEHHRQETARVGSAQILHMGSCVRGSALLSPALGAHGER